MTTDAPSRHVTGTRPERVGRAQAPDTVEPTGGNAVRVAAAALVALRLSIGFVFLWAFFDKLFGLGYATPGERAWINGGSPTTGFLSNVQSGPLKGFFDALAGVTAMDWLFMAGLLGIGAALVLGVALRPAAAAGSLLLVFMWFAIWPPATMAGGEPTGSNNPFMDDHLVYAIALVLIASLSLSYATFLGRRWSALPLVQKHSWLR